MTKEEFLRQKLSKKDLEILLKNQVDEAGDIDLMNLNLKGCDVYLNDLKANLISNAGQKSKKIFNQDQEADEISNVCQKARFIQNEEQKAEEDITNSGQQAKVIYNYNQKRKQ